MAYRANKSYTVFEVMAGYHSIQIGFHWPIPPDNNSQLWKPLAQCRQNGDCQVDSFPVEQSAQHHKPALLPRSCVGYLRIACVRLHTVHCTHVGNANGLHNHCADSNRSMLNSQTCKEKEWNTHNDTGLWLRPRNRLELGHINCVWDDKHTGWWQTGTENSVFLAGVRHADSCLDITQSPLQDLVRGNAGSISKAEERMVCEHDR